MISARKKVFRLIIGIFGLALLPWTALWAEPLQINDDGKKLIAEARQAYDSDIRDRPILADESVRSYVLKVFQRTAGKNKPLAPGVQISVTVLDSPDPELTTYMDGHVVISSGLVFGLDNEAQLAAMLAPQAAYLSEGYYLALYQQIKAAERSEKHKAVAGAIFSVLLDTAVGYAVDVHTSELTEQVMSGEATYGETMRRVAALEAGQQAYYGIKDVVQNIPAQDNNGRAIDPRMQFEPMADAQGLIYLAQAGYDPAESARGCDNLLRINQDKLKDQERMLGAFAEQMRAQRSMMEAQMVRMRQYMGDSGLVQTPSQIPPSRGQFLSSLLSMKEIKEATAGRSGTKGVEEYQAFLKSALLARAQSALGEERYEEAHKDFLLLYNHGVRTAPVAYGLAKSKLGDFAFGAGPAELKAAEKAYLEAIRMDSAFADPYRGLAQLYSDTEAYEKAAKAWQSYLKLAPDAADRKQIERKIKTLQRKASR